MPVNLTCNQKSHQCNPAHYNDHPQKSQWIPKDPQREFMLFDAADKEEWTDDTSDYWSIKTNNYNIEVLGTDKNREKDCRISRFRRDSENAPWHGYPITLTRKGEPLPKIVWKKWEPIVKRAWIKKIKNREV